MNGILFVSVQAKIGNHTGFQSVEILRKIKRRKSKGNKITLKCLRKANY